MTPATADSARDAASSDGGAEVLVRDDGLAVPLFASAKATGKGPLGEN